MSPLPTMSVRCRPEHQPLVRSIARALRDRPELADELAALLARPVAGPSLAAPSPDLANVIARLDAIERWIAECNTNVPQPETQPVVVVAAEEEAPPSASPDRDMGATYAAPHTGADFSARVAAARKARGWSSRKLATEAGVSQTTISHLESGRTAGNAESRAKIAAALEIEQ